MYGKLLRIKCERINFDLEIDKMWGFNITPLYYYLTHGLLRNVLVLVYWLVCLAFRRKKNMKNAWNTYLTSGIAWSLKHIYKNRATKVHWMFAVLLWLVFCVYVFFFSILMSIIQIEFGIWTKFILNIFFSVHNTRFETVNELAILCMVNGF